MKPNFSKENYEKARKQFLDASKKDARARRLLDLKDFAGSVEASQHSIELYIKSLYTLAGFPIPKIHNPGRDLAPIFVELKIINPDAFQKATVDPLARIKYISSLVSRLHIEAMYGTDDSPSSFIFTEDDAIYFQGLADEIMIFSLIIVMIFNVHYGNLPSEGIEFLKNIEPNWFNSQKK